MAGTNVLTSKSDVEIRVIEALEYIDQNPNAKILAVSRKFGVPRSRIQRRLQGIQPQPGQPTKNTKLRAKEEVALCRYIDRLNAINFAVRPELITDAANYIIRKRSSQSSTSAPETVGKL
ncbi:hypothetical protein E4U54_003686 [Claviceps lovelessii]|nr:hypothetical protein E4U54_003686 [Claviceps lovelessii]